MSKFMSIVHQAPLTGIDWCGSVSYRRLVVEVFTTAEGKRRDQMRLKRSRRVRYALAAVEPNRTSVVR